jgi:hypothetical protein
MGTEQLPRLANFAPIVSHVWGMASLTGKGRAPTEEARFLF